MRTLDIIFCTSGICAKDLLSKCLTLFATCCTLIDQDNAALFFQTPDQILNEENSQSTSPFLGASF